MRYVEASHGDRSRLYRFGRLECNPSHIFYSNIQENGCLAFIRGNDWSRKLLDRYDDSFILYSMWAGYLTGNTANGNLLSLLEGRNFTHLHTSGHATAEELRQIMDILRPRKGILPIHTEAPQRFRELFPQYHVSLLSDGETAPL